MLLMSMTQGRRAGRTRLEVVGGDNSLHFPPFLSWPPALGQRDEEVCAAVQIRGRRRVSNVARKGAVQAERLGGLRGGGEMQPGPGKDGQDLGTQGREQSRSQTLRTCSLPDPGTCSPVLPRPLATRARSSWARQDGSDIGSLCASCQNGVGEPGNGVRVRGRC